MNLCLFPYNLEPSRPTPRRLTKEPRPSGIRAVSKCRILIGRRRLFRAVVTLRGEAYRHQCCAFVSKRHKTKRGYKHPTSNQA